MQLIQCAKVALVISGATFTIASIPVARLANQSVALELNRSPVLSGQIRDFSGAYLSVAGLMSLSLGITGFSLVAWRQVGSRLKQTKQTVSELETLVKQRETQLQAAQLAPNYLQRSGLADFLDDAGHPGRSTSQGQSLNAHSNAPTLNPAPRIMTGKPQAYITVSASAPKQFNRHLSSSQAPQYHQAIPARLHQHPQSNHHAEAVDRQESVSRHKGFTVINPYQVQCSSSQVNRQRPFRSNNLHRA